VIKAIIFDIGGVLLRTHNHAPRRELEAEYGLEHGEVERLVFNSEMATKAQSGAISDEELWQWLAEQLALSTAGLDDFRERFWAGDVLDDDLVAYIRRLKPLYQTAILSNASDYPHHGLTRSIADAFDLIVWSADEKVMKPDKSIYQRTLARLDREAEEAVFVDDNAANVAAARDIGMHAVHYRPGMDVPQILASLGVLPAETNEGMTSR
jgi:HAD superfamily hydrolase (TIGR01509 family)